MSLLNLTSGEFDSIFDKFLTFTSKTIVVNIVLLDEIMHQRFGNYEEEHNWSMEDLIRNKYGEEAVNYVKSLI